MGGSKGGKHSKGKSKSKSGKNETSHKKPEAENSKHDLAQTSNDKACGRMDSKGNSSMPQTPGDADLLEKKLEKYLLLRLDKFYTKAKDWLLSSGYGRANIERAFLNNGHVDGPKDVINNILTNTVAFLERQVEAKRESFKDMKELYKAMLQSLIDSEWDRRPELQKTDVMLLVLVSEWGSIPLTSTPSQLLSGNDYKDSVTDGSHGSTSRSSNEGTSVLDLSSTTEKAGSTFIKQQDLQNAGSALIVGSNVEECSESPKDPKMALIADLMKSIKNLEEKVKVQRDWALKKVSDSANRLSKDILELKMLKMEKKEAQRMKAEKLCAEKSCTLMLKEAEQSLRNMNCEASIINNSIRTLELRNAHIRADTEALRLSASEYGNELNQVMHREMTSMKKLSTIGKQTSNLRAKGDEEKQKVLQLKLDVIQAEKEAMEAEERWKQEIREKEQTLALRTELKRMAGTHKAIVREELAGLRQQMETARNLKKDEVQRLEEELSRLRVFLQTSDVSMEGDTLLYNGVEVTSLGLSAPYEHSRHWNCMLCCTNAVSVVYLPCAHHKGDTLLYNGVEVTSLGLSAPYEHSRHWNCMLCCTNAVSVVYLPCAHQVVCAQCYEASCSSSVSGHCLYCGAEIQQCIKAFGPA